MMLAAARRMLSSSILVRAPHLVHRRPFSTPPASPPPPPPPIILNEDDIVETFVRGGGAGGQKINKTSSCVRLRHIPTGLVVRCQESRSQSRNRDLARRLLRERLDEALRGEWSARSVEENRERARKAVKRRKAVKKHFKSRRDQAAMGRGEG